MSEFWVSKKRYWCKYCGISIADDAPSRQHHESGMRHKGAVDRHIRDIYKTSERRKKDAAEEAREIARVDAAAQEAYAKDIGSGAAASSSTASTSISAPPKTSAAPKPPPPKTTDKFANYSTAESLGFVDESIAEAERKRTEGLVGDWQLVIPTPSSSTRSREESEEAPRRVLQAAATEEQAAAESSRNYRVGERRVGAGLEELWEPDVPIRLKVKGEQPEGGAKQEEKVKTEIDYGLPKATEMPVWKAKGWSKPGEIKQEVKEEPGVDASADAPTEMPTDTAAPPPPPDLVDTESEVPPVKNEPNESALDEVAPPSSGGGLFRKRKGAPTTAGTRNIKKR
ncbi:hypothetical protein BDV93DRAFT_518695 [Ceratobasidium sp. AG-I]|nr:hypothetical protein BDV93DRAFT_518695 [Ceratobasidium sp. AG-I]